MMLEGPHWGEEKDKRRYCWRKHVERDRGNAIFVTVMENVWEKGVEG